VTVQTSLLLHVTLFRLRAVQRRGLPGVLLCVLKHDGCAACDRSFFSLFFLFALPFPEDEEPRRNAAPSLRACVKTLSAVALSHLAGSFTLGSHTGTKGRHCLALRSPLMATCCFFSKAPAIASERWCFRKKISQDRGKAFLCKAAILLFLCVFFKQVNALNLLAFIDLAQSSPHALLDVTFQDRKGQIGLFLISINDICLISIEAWAKCARVITNVSALGFFSVVHDLQHGFSDLQPGTRQAAFKLSASPSNILTFHHWRRWIINTARWGFRPSNAKRN